MCNHLLRSLKMVLLPIFYIMQFKQTGITDFLSFGFGTSTTPLG